jgi:hypothetical protein
MVQKIKWTILALNDLHDIYEFIAKDSKRYVQIQVKNIQDAVFCQVIVMSVVHGRRLLKGPSD